MPIHIDIKSKKVTKPKVLPKWLIEELMNNYPNLTDLDQRLWKLPIVSKGKQENTYPRTNVNRYARIAAQTKKLDLYIGYFVYKHSQTNKWMLHEHVFNVNPLNSRVYEQARDMDWDTMCYYVGMQVPADDYENERFVERFSQLDYIKKHSPRSLFALPVDVESEMKDEKIR